MIAGDEAFEGDQQSGNLLASDLACAPDALQRGSVHSAVGDQVSPRPRLGMHVHVLMLQRDGSDQVGPPGQNAGCLRSPDCLPAGKADQRRPLFDEAAQV